MLEPTQRPMISIFVHDVGYSLSDLLGCHAQHARKHRDYMEWCKCTIPNVTTADGPWRADARGVLGVEAFLYEGLMRDSLSALGVRRTLIMNEADLYFVPAFAALSFLLGETPPGRECYISKTAPLSHAGMLSLGNLNLGKCRT